MRIGLHIYIKSLAIKLTCDTSYNTRMELRNSFSILPLHFFSSSFLLPSRWHYSAGKRKDDRNIIKRKKIVSLLTHSFALLVYHTYNFTNKRQCAFAVFILRNKSIQFFNNIWVIEWQGQWKIKKSFKMLLLAQKVTVNTIIWHLVALQSILSFSNFSILFMCFF